MESVMLFIFHAYIESFDMSSCKYDDCDPDYSVVVEKYFTTAERANAWIESEQRKIHDVESDWINQPIHGNGFFEKPTGVNPAASDWYDAKRHIEYSAYVHRIEITE